MNKLLTKIVGIALGATMAIGVGVAIASNNKETAPANAAGTSDWTQVLTLGELEDGNKYLIVSTNGDYYLNGSTSKGHFSGTAFDATHPASASAAGVVEFDEVDDNQFKMKLVSTNKYVTATAAKSGSGSVTATSDSYGWLFSSSSSGVFNAIYQESGKNAYLRYNSSDFRTYASTSNGTTIRIYKEAGTPAQINGDSSVAAGTQWSPTSVTEKSGGATVSGASFSFAASNGAVIASSNTSTGSFTASAPGTVTVSATKTGFRIDSKAVTVNYASVTSVTLSSTETSIAKNGTFDADDVTVTLNPSAYTNPSAFAWKVQSALQEDGETPLSDYSWNSSTHVLTAGTTAGTVVLRAYWTTDNSKYADFTVAISGNPIVNLDKTTVYGYQGGTAKVRVTSTVNLGTIATYYWEITSSTPASSVTVSSGASAQEVTLSLGVNATTATAKVTVTDTSSVSGEALVDVVVVPTLSGDIQMPVTAHDDVLTSLESGDEVYMLAYGLDKEFTGINTGGSTHYGTGASFDGTPSYTTKLYVVDGNEDDTFAFRVGSSTGNYLYWGSGNSLDTKAALDNTSSWDISFDEDGYATVTNHDTAARQLIWNISGTRFACYSGQTPKKSGDEGYGTTGYLYPKFIKHTAAHTDHLNNKVGKELTQQAVLNFVSTMNTDLAVCGTTGLTSSVWNTLAGKFTTAKASAQDATLFANMFAYATATARAVDGSATTGDALQNALARYNYILEKYGVDEEKGGYADFLGRATAGTVTPKASANIMMPFENTVSSNAVILILVVTSSITLVTIGGYFFLRKRKEVK